jgi:sialate O-acetylesterase
MEFELQNCTEGPEALAETKNPNVRFYYTNKIAWKDEHFYEAEKNTCWQTWDSPARGAWSAAGYFFAKKLACELDCVVGIIGCNWGGTSASAWMRKNFLEQDKDTNTYLTDYEEATRGKSIEQQCKEFDDYEIENARWQEKFSKLWEKQPGITWAEAEKVLGKNPWPGPASCKNPYRPTGLYDCMISRIVPYTLKGVLWYQGESDDDVEGSAAHYAQSLQTLIADWRALWGEELPFFVVQLPGFRSWLAVVGRDYPLIRQAQQETADAYKNVFLCSISDLGEELDIHPKNKKDVGERLALLALRHLYGRDILADPPRLLSWERLGGRLVLRFANAGEGLAVPGETLNALEIRAGEEALTYPFKVSGDSLELCAESAGEGPLTVSFAKENWYLVNLYNSAGLPAIPFEFHC